MDVDTDARLDLFFIVGVEFCFVVVVGSFVEEYWEVEGLSIKFRVDYGQFYDDLFVLLYHFEWLPVLWSYLEFGLTLLLLSF